MDDIRSKETSKNKKQKNLQKNKILIFLKKNKLKLLIFLLISIIIIFPSESGQAIGNFIHDFIGNIYNYSKF